MPPSWTPPPRAWHSARDLLKAARDAPTEAALHAELENIAKSFPRLAHSLLFLVLVGGGRRAPRAPPKRGLGLAAAFGLLEKSGFALDASHLSTVVNYFKSNLRRSTRKVSQFVSEDAEAPLAFRLPDFRLILKYWKQLEAGLQEWLSLEFLFYWQSPRGFEELCEEAASMKASDASASFATLIDEFRAIWEPAKPTSAQKLTPDRVLGLFAFEPERFCKFLESHVDMQADCSALIAEFERSKRLTAEIVDKQEGLIGACVESQPRWLAEHMLAGSIALPQDAKPQACLVLRLLNNFERFFASGEDTNSKLQTELTPLQHKHLSAFLTSQFVSAVAQRSNMMHQAMPAILSLALRVCERYDGGKRDSRAKSVMLKVTGYYVDGKTTASRIAKKPNSNWEKIESRLQRSETQVDTLPAVLDFLLDYPAFLPIDRWITHIARFDLKTLRLSDAFRRRFEGWTKSQLTTTTATNSALVRSFDSSVLSEFFQTWILSTVCTPEQKFEIWTTLVFKALDSFSFFRSSWCAMLPSKVTAENLDGPVIEGYAAGADVAALEPPGSAAWVVARMYAVTSDVLLRVKGQAYRELDLQRRLAVLWPARFVHEHGIAIYLQITQVFRAEPNCRFEASWKYAARELSCPSSTNPVVARKSHSQVATLSVEAMNDCLDVAAVFRSVLKTHSNMERSKTADEFSMLQQWVLYINEVVLHDAGIVERLHSLLCAVWSDHVATTQLCGVFVDRVLAAGGPLDALARFIQTCPQVGLKKSIRQRVKHFCQGANAEAKEKKLSRFYPLIAALSESVEDLIAFVHAVGVSDVEDEGTEELFWKLIRDQRPLEEREGDSSQVFASGPAVAGREAAPGGCPRPVLEQVKALRSCEFGLQAWLCTVERTECVEVGSSACWEEAFGDGAGSGGGGGGAGTATAAVVAAVHAGADATAGSEYAVYRNYGPRGEEIVCSALQDADPEQLADLFKDHHAFRKMCSPLVVATWQPKLCPPTQEAVLVHLITELFPALCKQFAPLVWGSIDRGRAAAPTPGSAGTAAQAAAAAQKRALEEDTLMRQLLRHLPTVGLDTLPKHWWHCLPFAKIEHESTLVRLVGEGGVQIDPATFKDFEAFGGETQKCLLDAHWNDVKVLVEHAPRFSGPVYAYLARIFALLAAPEATELLVKLGEGVTSESKLVSGWNKLLNALLCGLRTRIASTDVHVPNWLHEEEQLLLYNFCTSENLSSTNGAILGDFLETKYVDPLHVARVVSFVLSRSAFERPAHKQIRDSALRAMVRLPPKERDEVIAQLLSTGQKLPVYALFTICVAWLSTDMLVDGVLKQLDMLTPEEWESVGNLMRDANPAKADFVHTYPRSKRLQDAFVDLLLSRYLRGDNSACPAGPFTRVTAKNSQYANGSKKNDEFVKWHTLKRTRDARFFRMFMAVCEPSKVPDYLLSVLDRQLHPFPDPLLVEAFEDPSAFAKVAHFRAFVEHLPTNQLVGQMPWICARIRAAGEVAAEVETRSKDGAWRLVTGELSQGRETRSAEMVRAMLELLRQPCCKAIFARSLSQMLSWGGGEAPQGEANKPGGRRYVPGELLRLDGVQRQVREFLKEFASNHSNRDLWVLFFARTWTLEAVGEGTNPDLVRHRKEDLLRALPDCELAGKFPLASAEVEALGVDLLARKLLVDISPNFALTHHGRAILRADPAFARDLRDDAFAVLSKQWLSITQDHAQWAWIRPVVAAVAPERGLPLAAALLKQTVEGEDYELLKTVYLKCDRLTRRQARLLTSLGGLFSKMGQEKAGQLVDKIQKEIVDVAAEMDAGSSSGAAVRNFDAKRIDLVT